MTISTSLLPSPTISTFKKRSYAYSSGNIGIQSSSNSKRQAALAPVPTINTFKKESYAYLSGDDGLSSLDLKKAALPSPSNFKKVDYSYTDYDGSYGPGVLTQAAPAISSR